MVSEELTFLHRHREAILIRWKEHIRQSVNPDFFGGESLVTNELLSTIFGYILDALDQNHFHDLNRTFDTLVDRAYTRYISIKDVTGLLFGFIHATDAIMDQHAVGTRYDNLRKSLTRFSRRLRNVYSERVGRQASEIITSRREHIIGKWQRDIPTEAVSTHFSVLLKGETAHFVERTFEVANAMLLGTEHEPTDILDEEGNPKSLLDAYLDDQTDFFEPRGFGISSVECAVMHLEEIAEPVLFSALLSNVLDYRKALWVVRAAVKRLALAFSEHYNQRMMRNYYEEVSKMLHRIKNKITPAQTGLQTILPMEFSGRSQEGMLISPADGEALNRVLDAASALTDTAEQLLNADSAPADLESLRGAAETLRNALDGIDDARMRLDMVDLVDEFVRDALEAAELSTQLAKDLQEVQNDLIRREPPVWDRVNVNDLVRRAFEESIIDAKQKDIEYTLDMDDDEAYVFAIERQLMQPFAQVISNAIKYTPEGPHAQSGDGGGNGRPEAEDRDASPSRVTVTLTVEDDNVLFACQDSGIGIPEGEEELVFALCERCSNAKDFNKYGSGTGLYHDRKIIEQHNGRIWVESPGANRGSTFLIRLPRHRGDEQPHAG